jgi:hypothetical protein
MSLARLQDSANNAAVRVVPGDRIVGRRSIGDGVMRNMPLAASLPWQTKTLVARVVLNAAIRALIEIRASIAFRKSWAQQ